MKRPARIRLCASLAIGSALVACALDPLNPQPLPPAPEARFGADAAPFNPSPSDSGAQSPTNGGDDDDSIADGGAVTSVPDSGTPPPSADAGDAGDAGDADADAGP